MTILQAVILGIIQGLSEFIPISSSAHLVIAQSFLGWNIPHQTAFIFDVIIHLGTLISVIIYFRQDLRDIIKAVVNGLIHKQPFKEFPSRLGWIILLATIPAVIAGLLFKSQVEQTFSQPLSAGIFLSLTAILLLLADRLGNRTRQFDKITWTDGVIIGLFQAISLLPGISRSGSAIAGGMLRNLDRQSAARFSFLLSIPAIVGAALFAIIDLLGSTNFSIQIPTLFVGLVVSAIIGYLAIRWMLLYLGNHRLYLFALYCLAVSVTVITFSLLRS